MQNSRLTLLIIEFNYHAEILQAVCPLLRERFNLILFTTNKIWRKTGLDEANFLGVRTRDKRSSLKRFFLENQDLLSKADLVYFNTLERNYKFFAKSPLNLPTIVRIHNVNSNFRPFESISFKNFSIARISWHLLRETVIDRSYWYRKRFFDATTRIMLPSSTSATYLQEKNFLKYKNKITPYSLPFCYLQPGKNSEKKNPNVVKIAVTGSINPSRKDFGALFDAIRLSLDSFKKPIELNFLGGPKGKQGNTVVEKFQEISHVNFSFSYSKKYISSQEMRRRMRDIDFIVAPILVETHHKIYREIYGSSKISGVENDIVQFQKPALIPNKYRLNDSIKPVCNTYRNTEDLSAKLIDWVNGGKHLRAQENFTEMHSYKKEIILNQFETICRELI